MSATLFDSLLDTAFRSPSTKRSSAWLTKEDNTYYIHMDVPGVKKEDIKMSVEDNVLSVNATRYMPTTGEDPPKERKYSEYYSLSNEIDQDNISAKLEEGVLMLTLPTSSKHVKQIELT